MGEENTELKATWQMRKISERGNRIKHAPVRGRYSPFGSRSCLVDRPARQSVGSLDAPRQVSKTALSLPGSPAFSLNMEELELVVMKSSLAFSQKWSGVSYLSCLMSQRGIGICHVEE